MTNCKQIQNDLSAYIDNELLPTRKAQIDTHLNACPSCKQHITELERIAHGMKHLPQVKISTDFLSGVKNKIQGESTPPKTTHSLVSILFRPLWLKTPLDALALIIILVGVISLVSPRLQNRRNPPTTTIGRIKPKEEKAKIANAASKPDANNLIVADQKDKAPTIGALSFNEASETTVDEIKKQPTSRMHELAASDSRSGQASSQFANSPSDSLLQDQLASKENLQLKNVGDNAGPRSYLKSAPLSTPLPAGKDIVIIKSDSPQEVFKNISEYLAPLNGSIRPLPARQESPIFEVHLPQQHMTAFRESLQRDATGLGRKIEAKRRSDNIEGQIATTDLAAKLPSVELSQALVKKSKSLDHVGLVDTEEAESSGTVTNVNAVIQIHIISPNEQSAPNHDR